MPSPARVGAYHSLTARLSSFPHGELLVTARTAEGLVMAIRHKRARALAVQFQGHGESLRFPRRLEDRSGFVTRQRWQPRNISVRWL